MKTTILKRSTEFADCLSQENFGTYDSIELAKESLKPAFCIECHINERGSKHNYRSTKVNETLIIGNTYEECLQAYFVQQNRWTYINDINIAFNHDSDSEKFREFFYGKGGTSNAVACGQDMW